MSTGHLDNRSVTELSSASINFFHTQSLSSDLEEYQDPWKERPEIKVFEHKKIIAHVNQLLVPIKAAEC